MEDAEVAVRVIGFAACPLCLAGKGTPCVTVANKWTHPHLSRVRVAARDETVGTILRAWLTD